ncbi:MAG TPA: hypothetical protein VMW01_17025 [Williamwhitmania sp.]|nr:hypothetical protein [Williamwhitmania sp.]
MVWKYFLAWFLIIPVAIANGAFRELGYKSLVGDLPAHWISTLILIVLLALYLWLLGRRWRIDFSKQAWYIGVLWLGLTIMFEFGFGRYVMGHPWARLLHDYNLLQGRVWILVLVTLLIGPRISYGFFRPRAAG